MQQMLPVVALVVTVRNIVTLVRVIVAVVAAVMRCLPCGCHRYLLGQRLTRVPDLYMHWQYRVRPISIGCSNA